MYMMMQMKSGKKHRYSFHNLLTGGFTMYLMRLLARQDLKDSITPDRPPTGLAKVQGTVGACAYPNAPNVCGRSVRRANSTRARLSKLMPLCPYPAQPQGTADRRQPQAHEPGRSVGSANQARHDKVWCLGTAGPRAEGTS